MVRTGSVVDAFLIPLARRPCKVEEVIPDELASEDTDDDIDNDHPSGYTVEATYLDGHYARWSRKGKVFCMGTRATWRWTWITASYWGAGMPSPPTGLTTRNL